MQYAFAVIVLAGLAWVGRRLWPAIRSEPATWLGDGWNNKGRQPPA